MREKFDHKNKGDKLYARDINTLQRTLRRFAVGGMGSNINTIHTSSLYANTKLPPWTQLPVEVIEQVTDDDYDEEDNIWWVRMRYHHTGTTEWKTKSNENEKWKLDASAIDSPISEGDVINAYWHEQRGMFIPLGGGDSGDRGEEPPFADYNSSSVWHDVPHTGNRSSIIRYALEISTDEGNTWVIPNDRIWHINGNVLLDVLDECKFTGVGFYSFQVTDKALLRVTFNKDLDFSQKFLGSNNLTIIPQAEVSVIQARLRIEMKDDEGIEHDNGEKLNPQSRITSWDRVASITSLQEKQNSTEQIAKITEGEGGNIEVTTPPNETWTVEIEVGLSFSVRSEDDCLIFLDDFDRDDSTDVENDWVEVSGDWEIETNELLCNDANGIIYNSTLVNYPSDGSGTVCPVFWVKVTLQSSGAVARLICFYLDTNNYHFVEFRVESGKGIIELYTKESGTTTLRELLWFDWTWSDPIWIKFHGRILQGNLLYYCMTYSEDVSPLVWQLGTYWTGNVVFPFEDRYHGCGTGSTGGVKFDDFTVSKLVGLRQRDCSECPNDYPYVSFSSVTVDLTGFGAVDGVNCNSCEEIEGEYILNSEFGDLGPSYIYTHTLSCGHVLRIRATQYGPGIGFTSYFTVSISIDGGMYTTYQTGQHYDSEYLYGSVVANRNYLHTSDYFCDFTGILAQIPITAVR